MGLFFFFVTCAWVVTTAVGPETCAFGNLYGKLLVSFFLCCYFVVVLTAYLDSFVSTKLILSHVKKIQCFFFVTNVLEMANLF